MPDNQIQKSEKISIRIEKIFHSKGFTYFYMVGLLIYMNYLGYVFTV